MKRRTVKKSWWSRRSSFQISLLAGVAVIALASLIFAFRNPPAFNLPNFYAEDATVLFRNIYNENPIRVLLEPFNGYLIMGQYLLAYIAVGINFLIGNNLDNLPVVTAVVSCAFLGLAASLPFILFRRYLGTYLSLLLTLLIALVPLQSYDYAIIGTISNLKFVFLYIAFMLVVYRYASKDLSNKKYLLIDSLLVLCALTNATVAFLLPLILLPYARDIIGVVRSGFKKFDLKFAQLSACAVVGVTLLYTAAALVHGIPKIPGYLEGPFKVDALLPIIDRSTYFAVGYPITGVFNHYFVGGLVILTVLFIAKFLYSRKPQIDKYVLIAALWAVFLGTGLFVINRPGIGDYYLGYGHKGGPDQFFYAQNMIFIFAAGWLLKDWFKRIKLDKVFYPGAGLVLYLLLALTHGSSFGDSKVVYQTMGDIDANLQKACKQYPGNKEVIVQIYPTNYWQFTVDRKLACDQ